MREERNSGSNVCSRAWSVDVTLMCWCMLLLLFVGSVAGGSSNIKIGVLDNKANLTATFLQWQPTFENYLNSKLSALHINFSVSVVPLAFDNLTTAVKHGDVDLAFTNTGHCVTFQQVYGWNPLVGLENKRPGAAQDHFGGAAFHLPRKHHQQPLGLCKRVHFGPSCG